MRGGEGCSRVWSGGGGTGDNEQGNNCIEQTSQAYPGHKKLHSRGRLKLTFLRVIIIGCPLFVAESSEAPNVECKRVRLRHNVYIN